MKPSSCKAKGRALQQTVRDAFRSLGAKLGLEPDDIESRGMGQNGVDLIFSPAARRVFGVLAIECKNRETLNVVKEFEENAKKYLTALPLLIHKKNHSPALVTFRLTDYMTLLERSLNV